MAADVDRPLRIAEGGAAAQAVAVADGAVVNGAPAVENNRNALEAFYADGGEFERYVYYTLIRRFGAFVDMFHDWYSGFRLKKSADKSGAEYSRKYLKEAVEREIELIQTPAWRNTIIPHFDATVVEMGMVVGTIVANYIAMLRDVLLGNLSKIEASYNNFLETNAGIPWITPLDGNARLTYSDLLDIAPTVEQAAVYGTVMRQRFNMFELSSGDGTTLGNLHAAQQEIVGYFIVSYLFGASNAKAYFTCDAGPRDVRKALKHLPNIRGIITPQNIADSATTSLNNPLSSHGADVFVSPADEPGLQRFSSIANIFTPELDTYFLNGEAGGFSQMTPYNWTQNIRRVAPAPGWANDVEIRYGPRYGNEGASINHLMSLQKMIDAHANLGEGRGEAAMRAVRADKHVNLGPLFAPNTAWIQAKLAARDGSIFAGIKYAGDTDQGRTISRLREEFTHVCNVTLDKTQFNSVRLTNDAAIYHNGDTFLLYRPTITETPPHPVELEGYRRTKIFSDLQQVIKIVTEVCTPAPAVAGAPAQTRLSALLTSINGAFTLAIDGRAAGFGVPAVPRMADPLKRYLYQVKQNDIETYFRPVVDALALNIGGVNICALLEPYTAAWNNQKDTIIANKTALTAAKRAVIANRNPATEAAVVLANRTLITSQQQDVISGVATIEADRLMAELDYYTFVRERAIQVACLQAIMPLLTNKDTAIMGLREAITPVAETAANVFLRAINLNAVHGLKEELIDAAQAGALAAAGAGAGAVAAVQASIMARIADRIAGVPALAPAPAAIIVALGAMPNGAAIGARINASAVAAAAADAAATPANLTAVYEARRIAIEPTIPVALPDLAGIPAFLTAFRNLLSNPAPIYQTIIDIIAAGPADFQEKFQYIVASLIADQLKSLLDVVNYQIEQTGCSAPVLTDLINIAYEPGGFTTSKAWPQIDFYPTKIDGIVRDYRAVQRWRNMAPEFGRTAPSDFLKHLFDYNTALREFCGGLFHEAPTAADAVINAGGAPGPANLRSGQDIYQAYVIGFGPIDRRAIQYEANVEQDAEDEEEEGVRALNEFDDYARGGLIVNPAAGGAGGAGGAARVIEGQLGALRASLARYNSNRIQATRDAFYAAAAAVLLGVSMPAGFNLPAAAAPAVNFPFHQVGGVRNVDLGDVIAQYFAGMAAYANEYIADEFPDLHLRYRLNNYIQAYSLRTPVDARYVDGLGADLVRSTNAMEVPAAAAAAAEAAPNVAAWVATALAYAEFAAQEQEAAAAGIRAAAVEVHAAGTTVAAQALLGRLGLEAIPPLYVLLSTPNLPALPTTADIIARLREQDAPYNALIAAIRAYNGHDIASYLRNTPAAIKAGIIRLAVGNAEIQGQIGIAIDNSPLDWDSYRGAAARVVESYCIGGPNGQAVQYSAKLLGDLTVDLTARTAEGVGNAPVPGYQAIELLERYLSPENYPAGDPFRIAPDAREGADNVPRLFSLALMADFVLRPEQANPALSYFNIILPVLQGRRVDVVADAHARLLQILPSLPIAMSGGALSPQVRALMGLHGGGRRRTRRQRRNQHRRKTIRRGRD